MKRFLVTVLLMLTAGAGSVWAQCAMCRTQLENNFSNGDPGIAAGINTGILYLLAMPYVAVALIGYFWYKSSKNGGHKSVRRDFAG
jgi:LSD1 subclass zinc finger protein